MVTLIIIESSGSVCDSGHRRAAVRPLAQRLPIQDENLAAIQPEDVLRLKVPQDPADHFAHTAQLIGQVLMRCGNHRAMQQQQRCQPLIQPAEGHGIDETPLTA